MAKIAQRVIKDNGYDNVITVIPKRSTECVVGADVPEPAQLIVAELVDTELIGEGCLATYRHALKVREWSVLLLN